jgi:histone acetyltransferase 1
MLRGDTLYDENDFHMHLANPAFKAPGEEIASYTLNSNTYTVYKSSLADEETISLVDRIQIFVLLFIEGGSYIDLEDDRWRIYTLYLPSHKT